MTDWETCLPHTGTSSGFIIQCNSAQINTNPCNKVGKGSETKTWLLLKMVKVRYLQYKGDGSLSYTAYIAQKKKKNKTKKQPLFVLPGEVKWDSSNPWRTRAANLNLHSDFDVPHKPAGWFSKRTPWYHIRQWMDGRPGQHAIGDLWEVKQADKTKNISSVYASTIQ